jgi:2-keto-4-pentenoate hydratase/2-oxohepta-3-ene-1,7-dioic acid hydratase in catechol pathway
MRLVAFKGADGSRIGVVKDDGVIDLTEVDPSAPRTIAAAIREERMDEVAALAAKADAGNRLNYDDLDFELPIADPAKILCLGLNYMDHVAEGPFNKPDFPAIFVRTPTSLVPHGKPIIRPLQSESMDYEAELALIIGKKSRHLTAENALDAVAGYSIFNDGSVREYQRHTIQWTMGKNFDQTGPFGPIFVTPDELPEAADGLKIECRLNGETVQSSTTDMMIFKVVETLIYITEGLTLEPGDVVMMGTPSGVGHARKPPLWMRDGDTVEIEIEGIGILRNPIQDDVAS